MRAFFSPAERRVLDSLPPGEAAVIEALHEALDATLVEEGPPSVVQTSLDLAA